MQLRSLLLGLFLLGCAQAPPSPAPDPTPSMPKPAGTRAKSDACDTSTTCCYVGPAYTLQGNCDSCVYVCDLNGDTCCGTASMLCDQYDCGDGTPHYLNCVFNACQFGQPPP